jgi:hypothetical protein
MITTYDGQNLSNVSPWSTTGSCAAGRRCPGFAPVSDASFACELRVLPRPTTDVRCVDAAGDPCFDCVAVWKAFGVSRGRFVDAVLESLSLGWRFGCPGRLCRGSTTSQILLLVSDFLLPLCIYIRLPLRVFHSVDRLAAGAHPSLRSAQR